MRLLKSLYVNSFEVSSNRVVFCVTLKFESPDGTTETVYANISPAGAKTLSQAVAAEVKRFEEKFGVVDIWAERKEAKSNSENNSKYVS